MTLTARRNSTALFTPIRRGAISKKATAQVLLLLLSAAFLVYGASRGEAGVVLNKAVKLCLECVGIG